MTKQELAMLKRYVAALRSLKDSVRRSVNNFMFKGTGDTYVRNYQGLHQAIASILDDPYVDSMVLELPEDADESAKVSLVLALSSQLCAYLGEDQSDLLEDRQVLELPEDVSESEARGFIERATKNNHEEE